MIKRKRKRERERERESAQIGAWRTAGGLDRDEAHLPSLPEAPNERYFYNDQTTTTTAATNITVTRQKWRKREGGEWQLRDGKEMETGAPLDRLVPRLHQREEGREGGMTPAVDMDGRRGHL